MQIYNTMMYFSSKKIYNTMKNLSRKSERVIFWVYRVVDPKKLNFQIL